MSHALFHACGAPTFFLRNNLFSGVQEVCMPRPWEHEVNGLMGPSKYPSRMWSNCIPLISGNRPCSCLKHFVRSSSWGRGLTAPFWGWLFSWGVLISDGLLSIWLLHIFASQWQMQTAQGRRGWVGQSSMVWPALGFRHVSPHFDRINDTSIDAKWLGKTPTTRTYLGNLVLPFVSFSFTVYPFTHSKDHVNTKIFTHPKKKWMRVWHRRGCSALRRLQCSRTQSVLSFNTIRDWTIKYCCFHFQHYLAWWSQLTTVIFFINWAEPPTTLVLINEPVCG